jgi:hypothetical protein
MKQKLLIFSAIIFIVLTIIDMNSIIGLPSGKCAICHEEENGLYKCWVLQEKGGDYCTVNSNGTSCWISGVRP